MKASRVLPALAASLLPLLLSGCFLLSTTRKLPVPRLPAAVQNVSPEELVAQLDRRWNDLDTLNATVDIQASVLKTKQGVAKDYTSFRGHILMRKPNSLRVLGQVPVLGSRMFDMVSDGKNFTLYIPPKSKAVRGPNKLKKKSASQMENMRPDFFFDAIVVRGLAPGDFYSVTADVETVEDAAKKHLYAVPEYILSITRHNPGSQKDTPLRVIIFHRDDLMPYQQDLYDDQGNLETQVFYSDYSNFGDARYPARVVIKRPLEEYQIVMSVENVVENMKLTDDQFQIKIPEGTQVQQLE